MLSPRVKVSIVVSLCSIIIVGSMAALSKVTIGIEEPNQASNRSMMPAIATLPPLDPQDTKIISFAGREWYVKSGCGRGPQANCWSDTDESVRVDGEGLHLKVRQVNGVWNSAEVYSNTCTQYGLHRFFLTTRPDLLDRDIVAAFFLYKDDETEVDIEFAKWGEESSIHNAQYVIQPAATPDNIERFKYALNGTHSTHYINWTNSNIHFKSIHGHHQEPPDNSRLIHEWMYEGANNPDQDACLRLHFNFWLLGANAPSDSQEAEFIIDHAEFPLSYSPPTATSTPTVTPAPTLTPTPAATSTPCSPLCYVRLPIIIAPPPTPTLSPTPTIVLPQITLSKHETKKNVSGSISPDSFCDDNYRVVFYARTDEWYVQPRTDNPYVEIQSDCSWESSYMDPASAVTHWAAYLVKRDFVPPSRIGRGTCPTVPIDLSSDSRLITVICYPQ